MTSITPDFSLETTESSVTAPTSAQKIWPLTPAQRCELKARAHHLTPAVMIGQQGLTENILKAIEKYFQSQDLIKIRVLSADHAERDALAAAIIAQTHSQLVQHIGRQLVLFRAQPKKKKKPVVTQNAGSKTARRPRTGSNTDGNMRFDMATRPKPKASFTHKHRTSRFSER
jgi:putative YhbY family RNA-binding protein